jgi:hypothetical protein
MRSVVTFVASPRSRPGLQLQAADALELLNVIRHQCQATGERLSGNKQVVWADALTFTLQVGPSPRSRFSRRSVQGEFNDGRDEAFDLLSLLGRLQVFHRRQLALLRALESGIADVDGLKETFRPGLRPRRLKDHGIAILTDEHGCRQANALGQANSLAVAFNDDGCCFHAVKIGRFPAETKARNDVHLGVSAPGCP